MSDKEIVEKMQEGHGGWTDGMTGVRVFYLAHSMI